MERHLVKDHCYALFDLVLVLDVIQSQQLYLAAVDVGDVQKAADCGGLSGTVWPINPMIQPFGI